MQASFAPNGTWFVFDEVTGGTIRLIFRTSRVALD
jgi:hypothetical protein